MIQEDKELLLKDLCARLPYRVEIQVNDWTLLDTTLEVGHIARLLKEDIEIKPYLRPMSSMTDEERNEYNEYLFYGSSIGLVSNTVTAYELIDWLNAHHFDYRGLIEKGLAIEVTKENNPYEI